MIWGGSYSILGIYRLARVMNSHVLVVIGFGATGLAADMTRVRPRARVHPQMLFEIVRAVEGLVAHVARVRFVFLMLLHVS